MLFMVAGALAAGLAAAIATLPAEVVKTYRGQLFAGYSVLFAGSLLFLVAMLDRVQTLRVSRAAVVGAALGGVPNVLYWINYFLLPVDSVVFQLVARLGAILAAPGLHIPRLWGEHILLHHSHFSKEDSLIQWTIMTLINSIAWSTLFGAVALAVQRTRREGGASQAVGRSSASRRDD